MGGREEKKRERSLSREDVAMVFLHMWKKSGGTVFSPHPPVFAWETRGQHYLPVIIYSLRGLSILFASLDSGVFCAFRKKKEKEKCKIFVGTGGLEREGGRAIGHLSLGLRESV